MRLHRLERVQVLPVSLDYAWEFFSNPANLPKLTPGWLGLTVRSTLPERMYPGMLVEYTITPFIGIRAGWVTEITHVDEPFLFVDEQRAGPFKMWHHEHSFREVPGGLEMRDLVGYVLPLWPLSALIEDTVQERLDAIFDFRRDYLDIHLGPGIEMMKVQETQRRAAF